MTIACSSESSGPWPHCQRSSQRRLGRIEHAYGYYLVEVPRVGAKTSILNPALLLRKRRSFVYGQYHLIFGGVKYRKVYSKYQWLGKTDTPWISIT